MTKHLTDVQVVGALTVGDPGTAVSLDGHTHNYALGDLTDVFLTGLSDGDVLTYDLAEGGWIPAPSGGGASGVPSSGGTFTGVVDFESSVRFMVSDLDAAHQRFDARADPTNAARLHFYGTTSDVAPVNTAARQAWYDGSVYVDLTAKDNQFYIEGGADLRLQDGVFIAASTDDGTNIDHIWHNDVGNTWHMVSDGARKATGNTTLQIGSLKAASADLTDSLVFGSKVIAPAVSDRTKLQVWSSNLYGIGMGSTYTFGGLSDYAMTFQMNNTSTRGWWWGDDGHTNAQGAMSLTTDGRLTVAGGMRVGVGQSSTTAPGTSGLFVNGNLDVSGSIDAANGDFSNQLIIPVI